jgi:hypothetical protein
MFLTSNRDIFFGEIIFVQNVVPVVCAKLLFPVRHFGHRGEGSDGHQVGATTAGVPWSGNNPSIWLSSCTYLKFDFLTHFYYWSRTTNLRTLGFQAWRKHSRLANNPPCIKFLPNPQNRSDVQRTGANPTTTIYNASVVKSCIAANSVARF